MLMRARGTGGLCAEVQLRTQLRTRPALLLSLASGIGLLSLQRAALMGWQLAKTGIGLLLMVNTQIFVLPAIKPAASLAAVSATAASLAPALGDAVRTERIADTVNLLLVLSGIALTI
jgi:hypothetical protein